MGVAKKLLAAVGGVLMIRPALDEPWPRACRIRHVCYLVAQTVGYAYSSFLRRCRVCSGEKAGAVAALNWRRCRLLARCQMPLVPMNTLGTHVSPELGQTSAGWVSVAGTSGPRRWRAKQDWTKLCDLSLPIVGSSRDAKAQLTVLA